MNMIDFSICQADVLADNIMYVSETDSGRSIASKEERKRDTGIDGERRGDSDVDASTFVRKSVRELQMGEGRENTGVIDFWCLYFMLKIGWYIQAI